MERISRPTRAETRQLFWVPGSFRRLRPRHVESLTPRCLRCESDALPSALGRELGRQLPRVSPAAVALRPVLPETPTTGAGGVRQCRWLALVEPPPPPGPFEDPDLPVARPEVQKQGRFSRVLLRPGVRPPCTFPAGFGPRTSCRCTLEDPAEPRRHSGAFGKAALAPPASGPRGLATQWAKRQLGAELGPFSARWESFLGPSRVAAAGGGDTRGSPCPGPCLPPLTSALRCLPSERGGGPAGVLADEAVTRGRPEERRPRGVRDGPVQQPPVRLLRHPAGGQLLRQFPGTAAGSAQLAVPRTAVTFPGGFG